MSKFYKYLINCSMKTKSKPFRIFKNGSNTGIFNKIGDGQQNRQNNAENMIRIQFENSNK